MLLCASTHPECILILESGLFGHELFSTRFPLRVHSIVRLLCFTNILLEDVPQVIVQWHAVALTDSWAVVPIASIASSLGAAVFGVVRRSMVVCYFCAATNSAKLAQPQPPASSASGPMILINPVSVMDVVDAQPAPDAGFASSAPLFSSRSSATLEMVSAVNAAHSVLADPAP